MGAVTASADCSLVAVLCRTNMTHNAASVNGATVLDPLLRDRGDAEYMSHRGISNMWIYEWNDGVVSNRWPSPSSSRTLVNSAIGGWNMGHWELSLNADASVYMFELKVSQGGHEGSTNVAMYVVLSHRCCRRRRHTHHRAPRPDRAPHRASHPDRARRIVCVSMVLLSIMRVLPLSQPRAYIHQLPTRMHRWRHNSHVGNKTWIPKVSGGWACGSGHTVYDRIQYNTALDKWGRICTFDANRNGGDRFPELPGHWSSSFGSLGGLSNSTEDGSTEIMKMQVLGYGPWSGFGGLGAVVSLGADGFLVAAIKAGMQVKSFDGNSLHDGGGTVGASFFDCDTAGLLKIPAEGAAHFRSHRTSLDYGWNWFGDAGLFPESYAGANKRVTFANAANFGVGGENASEILVGWAERRRGQMAAMGTTDHFVVSRATREGVLIGQPWSLGGGSGSLSTENTGWGEDNNWVTVPATGCVVMSHVWLGDAGPGPISYQTSNNGTLSLYSNKLRLTSVCPSRSDSISSSEVNRPPSLRTRRGYGCGPGCGSAEPTGNGAPEAHCYDDDDGGLTGGEIFGIILLVVVITLSLGCVGMSWKNRKEATLGHAAKFPKVAQYSHMVGVKVHGLQDKIVRTHHHAGAKIHHKALPGHPKKTTEPTAEAKSKVTHNRVFGPIHHDNRDLTHHDHFKFHTADVGTGQHPVKPPTNPKKDAPPSWKARTGRNPTAAPKFKAKKWNKKADPFEGMRTARQHNFSEALKGYDDSGGHDAKGPPPKKKLW